MPSTAFPKPAPVTAVPQSAPTHRGGRRYLLLAALFCAGAFGAGAVLDRALPLPPVPVVKEKLEWLALHGDEYDTLFIGTSRTNGHVVPEVFDRLMAEAGMPTHSFNLGVNGMRSPEDTFLLETALSHRTTPLKRVIVEANAIPVLVEDGVHGTLRAEYWRDAKRFWAVCRCIAESRKKKGSFDKFRAFQYNLNVFLSRAFCLGRGRQALEAFFAGPAETASPLGKRCDGSLWYGAPLVNISDEGWADFESHLKQPFRPKKLDRASQLELREKRRLIEQAGAEMITFSPPVAGIGVFTPDFKVIPGVTYLNFALSAVYPELFQRENRADAGHLNRLGAELFTRRLAERVIQAKRTQTGAH